MNIHQRVLEAEKRIRPYIRMTSVDFSPYLSKLCGCKVYLKLESEQLTGSFKIRGALNKILSLTPEQRRSGVVAYSTGNHALGVAHASQLLGVKSIIFVPYTVSKAKLDALRFYPSEIKIYKKSDEETEITKYARAFAQKKHMTFVSPYNDLDVVAGQGTIGYEILQQVPGADAVFACVGGGGLISGIGGFSKEAKKMVKIVACSPRVFPSMHESVRLGKIVILPIRDTFSDGSVGNNELDTITFPLCQSYVDDWLLATERQIKVALRLLIEKHYKLVEGAAAVTLAALMNNKKCYQGKNVVLVLCGSNIGIDKIRKVIR